MSTPKFFTLSQAAKETGKSKSTLSKALKTGKMAYIHKDERGYQIDPAELFRVFPRTGGNDAVNSSQKRSRTTENMGENAIENTLKIKELELTVDAMRKERDFYKEQHQRSLDDRDQWQKQAERLLLTHEKNTSSSKRKKSGFIREIMVSICAATILLVGVLLVGYYFLSN